MYSEITAFSPSWHLVCRDWQCLSSKRQCSRQTAFDTAEGKSTRKDTQKSASATRKVPMIKIETDRGGTGSATGHISPTRPFRLGRCFNHLLFFTPQTLHSSLQVPRYLMFRLFIVSTSLTQNTCYYMQCKNEGDRQELYMEIGYYYTQ